MKHYVATIANVKFIEEFEVKSDRPNVRIAFMCECQPASRATKEPNEQVTRMSCGRQSAKWNGELQAIATSSTARTHTMPTKLQIIKHEVFKYIEY